MEQDLSILEEVQEWDKEIYSLREALDQIPRELAELGKEAERERAALRQLQEELSGLQLKQKEKEGELSSKEDHVHKYEAQLAQVKTNKEYASLRSEITSLKADNSLLEEAIIELIDQTEALQKKANEQKKALEAKEAFLQQKTRELEEKSKGIQGQMESLAGRKKEKMKAVNGEIASLYERIVRSKRGLALVKVNGEACPACQMQLRPQVLNEIKMKESIIVCDNCSRILYSA